MQDGAASRADVADDHGGWEGTVSVLGHQRHIDVELLKILQNKTTDKEVFHISAVLHNKTTNGKLFHVPVLTLIRFLRTEDPCGQMRRGNKGRGVSRL